MRTYLQATGVTSIIEASAFLAATTRLPGDADGLTLDTQPKTLNAGDPESAGGGMFQPDDAFPGNDPTKADDNVVTTAKGRITLTQAGVHTFVVQGDDTYLFRIKGTGGLADPKFSRVSGVGRFEMSNPNEFFSDSVGSTRGVVQLEAGSYDIEFVQFENAGGFTTSSAPHPVPGPLKRHLPEAFRW